MSNRDSNKCSVVIFKILFSIFFMQILFSVIIYFASINSSISFLIIISRIAEFIIAALIGLYIGQKNKYIFANNKKETKIYLGISVIILLVYLLGYFMNSPSNFLYSVLNKTGLYSYDIMDAAWYRKYFSILLEELLVRNMIFNFIVSLLALYGQNLLSKDINNK